MESDAELLHAFLDVRSEKAFAALVRRHLPLVYGAALRRLDGDAHRADDVAQQVFTALARKAHSLREHPALTGWLYTTTHHFSAKAMRSEQRRLIREKAAHTLGDGGRGNDLRWDEVRPEIDDALLELPERDRLAILLRYFQDRNFSFIGAKLGLTESGARMRTEQAMDSLRTVLARRGITSTAAALGGVLAAHGSVAAPAALTGAIAAQASSAAAAGGAILLMGTSIVKTSAVVVAFAAGAVGLILQNRTIDELRAEISGLNSELAHARRAATSVNRASASAAGPDEPAPARAGFIQLAANPANEALAAWAQRVESLKQRMIAQPEMVIPEQRYLTEMDWLDAAKLPLQTDEEFRRAMAAVRSAAEKTFSMQFLQPALQRYAKANNNQLPETLAQLQPFFDEGTDAAAVERWEVMPSSAIRSLGVGERMISQKAPVDETYDTRRAVGVNGNGSTSWNNTAAHEALRLAQSEPILQLLAAYRAANNGQSPVSPDQLLPYAKTQQDQAALQYLLSKLPGGVSPR